MNANYHRDIFHIGLLPKGTVALQIKKRKLRRCGLMRYIQKNYLMSGQEQIYLQEDAYDELIHTAHITKYHTNALNSD